MTTISRVHYCAECAKNRNPRTGQLFAVMGTTGWHVYQAQQNGTIGFTPAVYRIVKVIGENVVCEAVCAMNDCGFEIRYNKEDNMYSFTQIVDWKRNILTLKEWNDMVLYKHDPDYEL